jgi:hypothetical protein
MNKLTPIVHAYGLRALASTIGCNATSIHNWLKGKRTLGPAKQQRLIEELDRALRQWRADFKEVKRDMRKGK